MASREEIYRKYASETLLKQLSGGPLHHTATEPADSYAAVMFTDITDFTGLTKQLSHSGDSQKELADILSFYMGRMIDLVYENGGDVLKFAGDAFFAAWKCEKSGGESLIIEKALRTALEMQKKLDRLEVREGIRLRMKIALGSGRLHSIFLGGVLDRWEHVLAGEAMNEIGRIADYAEPGRVIITRESARKLAGRVKIRRSSNRLMIAPSENSAGEMTPETDISAGMIIDMRAFIPRAILTRLDEGRDPWWAELAEATVLFVNVQSFAYRGSASMPDAQKLMRVTQKSLYEFEGSVNRFGIDEKGAILLCAFGLPPVEHDDDPERAIGAALLLRRRLAEIGHRVSIGIATGTTFCGSVGNNRRSEYTLHGTNVNLAARLMKRGDGIYCDNKTYRKVTEYRFITEGKVSLKGHTEKISIYRVDET